MVYKDFDELRFFYESDKNMSEFQCICETCNKEFSMKRITIKRQIKRRDTMLRCWSCKVSSTKRNFSDEKKEMISNKRKETNLKVYGCENTFQLDKVIQNTKSNAKERTSKSFKTIKERYGVDNIMELDSIKKKVYETAIKKDPGFKNRIEKIKKTNLERRGHEWNFQDSDFHKKSIDTQIKKYGRPIYSRVYMYDDIFFDSSWELAYYVWLKDANIPFQYQPKVDFSYVGNDNKTHNYYPDFFVFGVYQEIKGNQFFNENNEPYDRINKKFWWEKYNCAMQNNIQILRWDDIKPMMEYVYREYGKDFFKKHKHKFDKS